MTKRLTKTSTKRPRKYRRPGLNAKGQIPESLKNFDALPASANVRQPVVEGVLACSAATVWRMVKAGRLTPIKVTEKITAFNVGELRKLLAA